MNFVYDLRFACDHFGGIGTHAYALLEAMLAQPGDERWTVLWNPTLVATRYDLSAIRAHPRVTWVERPWRLFAPFDLVRLGAWLRAIRADLYLSPFYLVPPFAGCPVAVTVHDVWPLRLGEGLSPMGHVNYRVALAMLRGARVVLTSSAFSRDEIVQLVGLRPERVRAVLLGLPPGSTDPGTPPANAPPNGFALVVGDNRPRKNLAVLAQAWEALGPAPPLTLVWAGKADPRYPALDALASAHGARGVVALGWVSEPELAWLYEHAEILLFPSLYEGFGLPLLEAMARGKPVIAADTPVFREVARDGALRVPPSDPEAWARAVLTVLGDEDRARTLRESGRRIAAELTYSRTARETLTVLREVAGTRRIGAQAGTARNR
jgi:glycosyltransferase involved in cell wall biosynthesis